MMSARSEINRGGRTANDREKRGNWRFILVAKSFG